MHGFPLCVATDCEGLMSDSHELYRRDIGTSAGRRGVRQLVYFVRQVAYTS